MSWSCNVAECRDAILSGASLNVSLRRENLSLCAGHGFAPNNSHGVEELHSVLGLVRAGFGITVLLESLKNIPSKVVFRNPRRTLSVETGAILLRANGDDPESSHELHRNASSLI
jgi:hypothetical protein